MTKTTVVFMQVSHKLTAPDNPILAYFKRVYAKCKGYYMPEHFMEIPTWIATVSGYLSDEFYNKLLHVVVNPSETVKWANQLPQGTIIMMSVMDVNRKVVHALVQHIHHKFVLGGYVEPSQFEQYHNAIWLSSVKDISHAMPTSFGVNVEEAPDYSLFDHVHTIPRLKMSSGCLYNCAFCTIERKVVEESWSSVVGQLDAMRQLHFELVYLDDKTFGQADNWTWLQDVYEYIKTFNPKFRGFIVQTTVPMAQRHLQEWVSKYHVAYVEVGVEHVDDGYLRKMRKPYNLKQLDALCNLVRKMNEQGQRVGFIPNLMFALPDADYASTLEWVKRNQDIITFANPFILSQYGASKGALVENADGVDDQNENSLVKSWLTPSQVEDAQYALKSVFNLTGGM